MCGRFQQLSDADLIEINKIIAEVNKRSIERQAQIDGIDANKPKVDYSIEPKPDNVVEPSFYYPDSLKNKLKTATDINRTDKAAVFVQENFDENAPVLKSMKWGFPSKYNDSVHINARSESVLERAAFAIPFTQTRCVIPATGFYEWTHDKKGKAIDKYFFVDKENPIIYMAGIYDKFNIEGEQFHAFTILTTQAENSVKDIHDRMPVCIKIEDINKYLTNFEFAQSLIKKSDIIFNRLSENAQISLFDMM